MTGQVGDLIVRRDEFATLGRVYPPVNRPFALKQWLDRSPDQDETVVVLDPDMVFAAQFDVAARRGVLLGHDGGYSADASTYDALRPYTRRPDRLKIPIPPLVAHREDLRRLVDTWLEVTVCLYEDPITRRALGWLCEMWAVPLAAARMGLSTAAVELAVVPPRPAQHAPSILRYAWKTAYFDKRQYRPWDRIAPEAGPAYEPLRAAIQAKRRHSHESSPDIGEVAR